MHWLDSHASTLLDSHATTRLEPHATTRTSGRERTASHTPSSERISIRSTVESARAVSSSVWVVTVTLVVIGACAPFGPVGGPDRCWPVQGLARLRLR